jgi:geranylgeranyl reductase family protein
METDVAIVGGGPAGAAAAVTLARAGVSVVVVDKARFPRDKCCGDGLTTGALRALEQLAFEPSTVPSWQVVDDAWVRSPSGREVCFPLPEGRGLYAAVAPRAELDAALLDLARSGGAAVHEGHALSGADGAGPDRVALAVEGLGTLEARYVIGADGMWSPLRKHLGLATAGYLGEWHAFRQYFGGVTGPAAERLYVWFEPDVLPGYAWSFPLPGGRANVGVCVVRDGVRRVQDLGQLWPDLLARPHVRSALGPSAHPEAPHKAWPIPARIDRSVLGRGRALFVGDAAAAADPLTGEGIAQALQTGRWAAGAILAAGTERPDRALASYTAAVGHHLVADHRMSVVLGRILRHTAGARGAVRVAGATGWTRRRFGRWLFEDEPRALIVTPRRWHRRFLDRDGAYAP